MTAIICTISKLGINANETLNTLKFGSKAKTIKNKVKITTVESESVQLSNAQKRIKELEEKCTGLE
jgi:hypothetical protein